MTPEREAYLKKCSKRELFFRRDIEVCRHLLTCNKIELGELLGGLQAPWGNKKEVEKRTRLRIRNLKWQISFNRHEIHRLNGMGRVVIPIGVNKADFWQAQTGECSCGNEVIRAEHRYCSSCGRRILWEKAVK